MQRQNYMITAEEVAESMGISLRWQVQEGVTAEQWEEPDSEVCSG